MPHRDRPALLSPVGLGREVQQGVILAATTLPLSLLLASLSGAPASAGLISATVGSLACVFLGGTRAAISGPSLATALVASNVVLAHGIRGLGIALVVCGLLQLATGALGLGRVIRLVPPSVIQACVVGIAISILLAQLPLAFGVAAENGAGLLERLDHLGAQIPRADVHVLAIAVATALLGAISAVSRRVPGAILGLVGATVAVMALGIELPMLSEPEHVPLPALPQLPSTGLAQLVGASLELFALCTLSTLVSTAALEQIDRHPTDPDQELIGNGIATMVVALLGGLPTAQLIARTELAARLGVRSRRPGLVQAIAVGVAGVALWPFLTWIPLVALTGVAVAVAVPLLDPRPLRDIARVSRFEIVVGGVTVVTSIFGSVALGLIVGLALSFGGTALRVARTRAVLHPSTDPSSPHQLSFGGPITFLASLEMTALRASLAKLEASAGLLVDLRSVVALDATGALALIAVLDDVRVRGGKVALLGPSRGVRARLARADARDREGVVAGELALAIATHDREADQILGKERSVLARPKLLAGLQRFRDEKKDHYDSLFSSLADGQHPHTMFITCADSRIDPALLMGSHPGDLFIVRALGALVAPKAHGAMFQEGAAIEYGVGVLGIRNIVVCGHSKCGAVGALKKAHVPEELETLGTWAQHAAGIAGDLASFADADEAARAVTRRQVQNLLSYPLVRAMHDKRELQIHAWFYDIGAVEVFEWSEGRGRYDVLGAEPRTASIAPPRAIPEPPAQPGDRTE